MLLLKEVEGEPKPEDYPLLFQGRGQSGSFVHAVWVEPREIDYSFFNEPNVHFFSLPK